MIRAKKWRNMSLDQRFRIRVFFADALAPWQRGTNEATNGQVIKRCAYDYRNEEEIRHKILLYLLAENNTNPC